VPDRKAVSLSLLYVFSLLVVFFVEPIILEFDLYSFQRIFLVSLSATIFLFAIFFEKPSQGKVAFSPLFYLFFLMAAFTPSRQAGFFAQVEISSYLLFALSAGGLANYIRIRDLNEVGAYAFAAFSLIIGGFFICLNFGFYWLSGEAPYIMSGFNGEFPLRFENVRFWSHTATWLVPLIPLVILGKRKWHPLFQWGPHLLGVLWVWMLFATASRGSLLSLVSITAIAGLLSKDLQEVKLFFKEMVKLLIGGLILWVCLNHLLPVFLSWESKGGLSFHTGGSGRLILWAEALLMSFQNFPFGMGGMSWMTHQSLTEGMEDGLRYGAPHNMYLLVAAEYGWIALIIVLFSIFQIFRKSIVMMNCGDKAQRQRIVVYSASITASLVHSLFSGIYISASSMIVGLFVWSIFLAEIYLVCGRPKGWGRLTVDFRCSNLVVRFSLGLLIFVFIFGVHRYYYLMIEDSFIYRSLGFDYWMPRFWLHGIFPR